MFTATDNLDEFRREVDRASRELSDGIRRGVAAACAEGAEEARSTHRFQNRTHALEGSIRGFVEVSTPGGASGVIEAAAQHASFVDGGTPAHEIRPRDPGGVLAFQAGGRTVFARSVQHPGTRPDGFMGRAYHKAERVLLREVEVAVARAQDVLEG